MFLNIFYTFKQIVSSSKNINSAWVLGIGKLSFPVFSRKMFETIGPSGYLDILRCANLSIYFQKNNKFPILGSGLFIAPDPKPSQAKLSQHKRSQAKANHAKPWTP